MRMSIKHEIALDPFNQPADSRRTDRQIDKRELGSLKPQLADAVHTAECRLRSFKSLLGRL